MTAFYLIKIVHLLYLTYTGVLFARILGSWFPEWHRHKAMQFVCFLADPYLNVFRQFLPPLGGVLDLSPMLAFFVLRLIEMLLFNLVQWIF